MSRQQLQESEATASPDKGVLATVLNYLKAKNLKVTEEALKRELGMHDESMPRLAHSGTEPEKYEESYSSNHAPQPSTSLFTSTTRAELQLAIPTTTTTSITSLSVNTHKQFKDLEDTQSCDDNDEEDIEPNESEEEEEDDNGDSTMDDYSNDDCMAASSVTTTTSAAASSNIRTGSRSLSWPGSIQLQLSRQQQQDEQEEEEEEEEDRDLQSPSSTSRINGHLSSFDKTPLWVQTSNNNVFKSRSSSDGVSPLQRQPQPLIIQGATPTPTQIPIGGPFFYQLAPAPGSSLTGGSRQQVIAPILTVLPANTSLVNPTLARAMNMPTSGQPLVLNTTQSLGLSPIAQQSSLSGVQQKKESEKSSGLSSINLSNTEPTTGQTMTSPLMDHIPMHSLAGRTSPTRTLASIPLSELTPQYSELKAFAEEFKSKRIRLGFTQGAVGQSLADKGYSNFAQSTISRFEQMQLSPTNAAAIKQVLEKWLQEAENPEAAHSASSTTNLPFMASRKRKKRAVFTPQTRTSLDSFFKQNPRPNRQIIESIANQLELLPEEVRVWFCNKRQKHKQNQSVYHYDQDLSLATSSGASSPTSLYESPVGIKRSTPSPKTPFTIEELSKSSTTSSSAVTHTQLTSPFMSPTSLVMAVTTPKLFFNPLTSIPVTTTAVPKFIPSPPWSVAQTTA